MIHFGHTTKDIVHILSNSQAQANEVTNKIILHLKNRKNMNIDFNLLKYCALL